MRGSKEIFKLARNIFDMNTSKKIRADDAGVAMGLLHTEILLNIRDIAEGIDRRLGAAAIKKSVKKAKK